MNRDEHYIKRCLELAQRAKGDVAPNPMVGAVLVYKDRIIGEGWHEQYGSAHAEVNCINSVKKEDSAFIKDSTMYVSLEPCSHFGNTPPCANRLVSEKVKEVIVCNIDPFPKVKGGGIKILEQANIITKLGVLEDDGLWVNRRFFCFHQQKRPYVILKWAQTVNGYFAPINRARLQLTNKSSKQLVHKWRTEEAAIMVGYQTAMSDDPELTAREWSGNNPLRIVLDRTLSLSNDLNLFNSKAETWIINDTKDDESGNVHYVKLDFEDGLLGQVLERLYNANKTSLIVEGGAKLLNGFIDAGLWDEARVFTASNSITEGISAPVLKNVNHNDTMLISTDTLNIYTNQNTNYKYRKGWEL